MKITLRLISLLCASVMLLAVFTACQPEENDTGNSSSESEAVSDGETREPPAVEKKNYGEDFNSLTLIDMFPDDYFFTKENKFDDMTNSVYERMTNVSDYLGVNITSEGYNDFQNFANVITTQVKAGDDTYQIGLSHVYQGLYGLVTGNKIANFEEYSQIQLDKDYWNSDLMEELRLNDGLFLGYSEFNLATTYVIMYNKPLYADYMASAFNGESIYDIVNNKKWTIDKLISMSSVCSEDLDGDGIYEATDQYGFAGFFWVPACGFMQSCNINILARNADDEFELSCTSDENQSSKLQTLVEKLTTFTSSKYVFWWEPFTKTESLKFGDGNTLFFMETTMNLKSHAGEDVKFGVLPYPMFDEEQGKTVGYRQLNWGGFMVIPDVTSNKTAMVGDTIEMLAYYSKPVTISFYETLLGAKVADAPEDAKMLEIIWDSICSDPGLTYSSVGGSALDPYVYLIPRIVVLNQAGSVSSYDEAYGSAAENALKRQLNRYA